ncbi:MAG: hypothetical protein OEZ05_13840 [Nitrospirota bacterium]|nr:hypothetical protein [Nitrospirota bacterium]MDH5587700.1 hypothetical protein [Nitrospirota bacterium]
MKNKLILGIVIMFTMAMGEGCVSTKSYVDPSFGKTAYEDLKRPAKPFKWRVVVEFQRHGNHLPQADSELRGHVERVLRASGVGVPTQDKEAPELLVVVNNFGDTGSAAAKGVGTGLTFGLVGNTVTDMYEMTFLLSGKGQTTHQKKYSHALRTAIGNESLPSGVEPMTPSAAFGVVVEQMLLKALKEFEESGVLSSLLFDDLFDLLGISRSTIFG